MKKTFRKLLAYGFVSYASASCLLFYYPHLLHGKPKSHSILSQLPLTICAHRCGSYDAFENTVPAAVLAATKSGAPMIDFDLQVAKDGTPMLAHDRNEMRTSNNGMFVTDFPNGKHHPFYY